MPKYDYTCEKCGHQFEFSQSMKDAPLAVCPKDLCPKKRWGKGKVRRGVGGGSGIIFKGSGFYITDYRSEGYKSSAKQDAEAGKATPAKTEAKTEPKSDSKPAAKPAADKGK